MCPGTEIPNTYWAKVLWNARERNIEVHVTPSEAWEVFREQHGQCALTGDDLWFYTSGASGGSSNASLDRINNEKGYYKDNVQWVTALANNIKGDKTLDQLCAFGEKLIFHS